jgi:high-affinity iron transporter
MLREGLEMALVVAIVLAYLRQLGRREAMRTVWLGALAAAALSIAAGAVVFTAVGDLHGRAEQLTEGITAFAAAGLLTWMVFWMARQARMLKSELHHKIDAAVASGSVLAVAGVAFFGVLREGLETVVFLIGSTVGHERAADRALGGLAGMIVAVGIGYLVYTGSRRVNLRSFFKITGIVVLFFAAGLLARAVHEFQEAALIGSLHAHVFTLTSPLLNPDSSRLGEFLEGLFGWNPSPSLEMILVYVAYVLPVGLAFLAGTRMLPALPPPVDAETAPAAVTPR